MRSTIWKLSFLLLSLPLLWTACGDTASDAQADEADDMVVAEPAENTLTDAEKAEGWTLLFDGTTTSEWRGYTKPDFPTEGWTVENGQLVVHGGGGDIITRKQYGNFDLRLDFMLTDTANSGILYLVQEVEGQPSYYQAPEYQILDDAMYETLGDGGSVHKSGANYDIEGPEESLVNPPGEWNTARIVLNNRHVEHYLNGQLVTEYTLDSPEWKEAVAKSKFKDWKGYGLAQTGHIGLQDHGHPVYFRNIKIRAL